MFLSHFSRRSPTRWGWACPLRARSLNLTMVRYGRRARVGTARSFVLDSLLRCFRIDCFWHETDVTGRPEDVRRRGKPDFANRPATVRKSPEKHFPRGRQK